jgi:hypothetical protein
VGPYFGGNALILVLFPTHKGPGENFLVCSEFRHYTVIGKVMKTQHQNSEFNSTGWDSIKNLQKNTLDFNGGSNSVSFILSFLFSERLHYSYLYNYDNYSQTLCIKCWVSAFHTEI